MDHASTRLDSGSGEGSGEGTGSCEGSGKRSGSPPLLSASPGPGLGNPPRHATRPRTHRPDVAHSRIFPIRASNCPAEAWATAGPPHTRRSSLWICPCVCPVR
ncbi:hypothetical protein EHYA_09843 [Embleya hyalina]|uniref:Uncharacterized protein n=1 Tax=Embleya hyalina TaxID=516124 RepID=A0A401Z5G8_9ACTN|nr:hypothetical protein EHYA_09843 [Embleya hyalina]